MRHDIVLTINYTIGIESSVAITYLKEYWVLEGEQGGISEEVLSDLKWEGSTTVLDCMDIDLTKQGVFQAILFAKFEQDEGLEYEIISTVEL